MRLFRTILFLFICALPILSACGGIAGPGDATPTTGVTLITITPPAPGDNPPDGGSTASGTRPMAPFPLPTGTPADTWNEIPVMPGALTGGDRAGGGYAFTIQTGEAEVIVYYDKELANRGWSIYARGSTKDERFTTIFSISGHPRRPRSGSIRPAGTRTCFVSC